MDRRWMGILKSVASHGALYGWCLRNIPMVLWLTPKILELSDQHCRIKIPLGYRSKNHFGSMYFGALCVGADLAAALIAMKLAKTHKEASAKAVSVIFKDLSGQFLRRSEQDTLFVCECGSKIIESMNKSVASGQRVHCPVTVQAYEYYSNLKVAEFQLTLSFKPSSA